MNKTCLDLPLAQKTDETLLNVMVAQIEEAPEMFKTNNAGESAGHRSSAACHWTEHSEPLRRQAM